jgi:hypothetical protein
MIRFELESQCGGFDETLEEAEAEEMLDFVELVLSLDWGATPSCSLSI